MAIYSGRGGRQAYTLNRRLGGGGEGEVFGIEGQPDLVAKLYYDKKYSELAGVVPDPRDYLCDKIRCMIDSPVSGYTKNDRGQDVLTVAWPRDALFDGKGQFVGYVMPKVPSRKSIHTAYRPAEQHLLFATYTWKSAITIAFNLASAVSYLHARGIVIGDFNSNNILIDEHGFVTLIDSDSFSVDDRSNGGALYKCMVGVKEVLAPELQGKDLSKPTSVFTKESDCFSLAIHIFRLIMGNIHPFGCDGMDRSRTSSSVNPNVARIARGECPYVSSSKTKGQPQAPDVNMLPQYIRNLFDRAFTYDATTAIRKETIAKRPSAEEWKTALAKLHSEAFSTCAKNYEHMYLKPYGHCPWCAISPSPSPIGGVHSSPNGYASPISNQSNSSNHTKTNAGNIGNKIRRESWPLWVACTLVGLMCGPLIAGASPGTVNVAGISIERNVAVMIISVVGAIMGAIIAHFAQESYQKAYNGWPWLLVCLVVPLATLLVIVVLGVVGAVVLAIVELLVGLLVLSVICGCCSD